MADTEHFSRTAKAAAKPQAVLNIEMLWTDEKAANLTNVSSPSSWSTEYSRIVKAAARIQALLNIENAKAGRKGIKILPTFRLQAPGAPGRMREAPPESSAGRLPVCCPLLLAGGPRSEPPCSRLAPVQTSRDQFGHDDAKRTYGGSKHANLSKE